MESRTVAHEENCILTLILNLTLTQTLTLPGGKFSSGAIVWTAAENARNSPRLNFSLAMMPLHRRKLINLLQIN